MYSHANYEKHCQKGSSDLTQLIFFDTHIWEEFSQFETVVLTGAWDSKFGRMDLF